MTTRCGEAGKPELTKPCPADGCAGAMYFHHPLTVADAPHTLEWPWHATWVCAQDCRHFEVVSEAGYSEILRLLQAHNSSKSS